MNNNFILFNNISLFNSISLLKKLNHYLSFTLKENSLTNINVFTKNFFNFKNKFFLKIKNSASNYLKYFKLLNSFNNKSVSSKLSFKRYYSLKTFKRANLIKDDRNYNLKIRSFHLNNFKLPKLIPSLILNNNLTFDKTKNFYLLPSKFNNITNINYLVSIFNNPSNVSNLIRLNKILDISEQYPNTNKFLKKLSFFTNSIIIKDSFRYNNFFYKIKSH